MEPLFAMAPVETASTEAALLQELGVETRYRVFSDYSAREISAMYRLRQQGRDVCIKRFLCGSRDAESHVDYKTGDRTDEFSANRYIRCEFYRSEIDYWQAYWQAYRRADHTQATA